jgi:hypothetical protein
MNINLAIKIMKKEVTDRNAIAYINALEESINEYGTKGLIVQLNYILFNLSSWKGENAREVKKFINSWVKEKSKNEK